MTRIISLLWHYIRTRSMSSHYLGLTCCSGAPGADEAFKSPFLDACPYYTTAHSAQWFPKPFKSFLMPIFAPLLIPIPPRILLSAILACRVEVAVVCTQPSQMAVSRGISILRICSICSLAVEIWAVDSAVKLTVIQLEVFST